MRTAPFFRSVVDEARRHTQISHLAASRLIPIFHRLGQRHGLGPRVALQPVNPADEIVIGSDEIALRIVVLREQRVLLDADLARIYGVPTKRLNEQVKRNAGRFSEDFVFQLTRAEAQALARLRSRNATLRRGQHIKHLPYVFTEHGAIQAANVLNSEAAVVMGVHVVRAFVRLRQWRGTQAAFATKLGELEARVG